MAKQTKMPKEVFVYVGDRVDGKPILYVAESIDDITEEYHGEIVGRYVLKDHAKFTVKREWE